MTLCLRILIDFSEFNGVFIFVIGSSDFNQKFKVNREFRFQLLYPITNVILIPDFTEISAIEISDFCHMFNIFFTGLPKTVSNVLRAFGVPGSRSHELSCHNGTPSFHVHFVIHFRRANCPRWEPQLFYRCFHITKTVCYFDDRRTLQ